jgi:hypothetical protein
MLAAGLQIPKPKCPNAKKAGRLKTNHLNQEIRKPKADRWSFDIFL